MLQAIYLIPLKGLSFKYVARIRASLLDYCYKTNTIISFLQTNH